MRRYGTDAAILYSDIVTPIEAIGFGVDVAPGIGPVVERPFTSAADLERIRPLDPEADTPYVLETVRNLVRELGDVPLIGFAGAPFTVASYLVEGRPSRTYEKTKRLMYTDPELWFALLDRLADLALASLQSQVANGASAVQLFDSWAGALSPSDYRRYVLPASQKVLDGIAPTGVPRIHFGVSTGELLPLMQEAGADVVGIDWRVDLDDARARLGDDVALQGNLDPVAVLAGADVALDKDPRRAAPRRRPPRPHLQPGPRRAARDRPRGAGAHRGAGPHRGHGPDEHPDARWAWWSWPTAPRPRPPTSSRTTPTSAGAVRPPRSSSPT